MAVCKKCNKDVGCGCNLTPKHTGICSKCLSEQKKDKKNSQNNTLNGNKDN